MSDFAGFHFDAALTRSLHNDSALDKLRHQKVFGAPLWTLEACLATMLGAFDHAAKATAIGLSGPRPRYITLRHTSLAASTRLLMSMKP